MAGVPLGKKWHQKGERRIVAEVSLPKVQVRYDRGGRNQGCPQCGRMSGEIE